MIDLKLTFIGADHEVTGSCHCLEACGKKIIVDCGMEQGSNKYVNQEMPFAAAEADFVLITHTHIDHIGLVPLLFAHGYRGPIYATFASCRLGEIMLRDCAHIQESEAEWKSRKAQRAGRETVEPLYTMNDVETAVQHFVSCHYNDMIDLCDGIRIRFRDAGHLLGSASIEVWIEENGEKRKLVFSGDIGNLHQPLIKDPTYLDEADYVLMESTYGARSHGPEAHYEEELEAIVERTLRRGGNVVIPCFAVGRTQEVLYFLRKIKQDTKVDIIQKMQVYVDSPLAVQATQIFGDGMEECFDEETLALIAQGINPITFPGLHTITTSVESQQLNFDPEPKVILSASGMCDAGRIRHHLKHNLWRKESAIVFAGYQAAGTLGRQLQDGAGTVKLFGEEIQVNAEITQISGISGHADHDGLIKWITAFKTKPKEVFVVHGDDEICDIFADELHNSYGLHAFAPFSGACFDLISGEWVREGVKEYVKQNEPVSEATAKKNTVFARLVAAGQRLAALISRSEGGSNKDLARFADQLNNLCDKWDR